METIVITDSDQETRAWGEELGAILQAGDIVALIGELGAGKTVLAQGILKGLGVEETVQSPSFIMAREYAGRFPVVHIDLYRLRNSHDFLDLGFSEYFDGRNVVVIEWAEKILDLLPPHHHYIRLTWDVNEQNKRLITHRYSSDVEENAQ
jgi:tRNA threonylcarbamoyladenosine biosynthesis protein TsaE